MPKVHKRTARTDRYVRGLKIKTDNIKGYKTDKAQPADENDKLFCTKGTTYYTWTLYGSAPSFSLTPPDRRQLTNSAFLVSCYDVEDSISDLQVCMSTDEIRTSIEEIVSNVQTLTEETEESLEDIPESLQEAPTAELLRERIEALEELVTELENVECEDFEAEDFEPDGDLGPDELEHAHKEHEEQQEIEAEMHLQSIKEDIESITFNYQ